MVVFGMPRTPNIDPLAVQQAQVAADSATNLEELRRAQAVLLPALLRATLAQTASALGVGRATVTRLQAAFRQRSAHRTAAPARPWGGRRHGWMTLEEERTFLEPWIKLASAGSLLVRLMFQDEARFGRLVRRRRCWAPAPIRPVVDKGCEREFT